MEYSFGFAWQLIEAAKGPRQHMLQIEDAKRAVLYLCLLSIEITLKHLLEKAGVPVRKILKRNHKIRDLLKDLDNCEVMMGMGEMTKWESATAIGRRILNVEFPDISASMILNADEKWASKYPSEIRYGPNPTHFSPDWVFECAHHVADWASMYGDSIRLRSTSV